MQHPRHQQGRRKAIREMRDWEIKGPTPVGLQDGGWSKCESGGVDGGVGDDDDDDDDDGGVVKVSETGTGTGRGIGRCERETAATGFWL